MPEEIQQKLIEQQLKEAYLDYAMSVIVGRALPDVYDGLKPVHRRILYAMHELGMLHSKPTKKSARVVGETLGKYHPHGDVAVYDALVRMAQDFSLRYPLIIGQGNFGSVDGDSPASMRYTECKLSKIGEEMLADLDKKTVKSMPNFDNTLREPTVLPAKIPNLLINGTSGIAVGMATNIPPHNLSEVLDAAVALIDNPELEIDELMKYIPGPDFPTSAFIAGRSEIRNAYRTGRGKITLKAKAEVKDRKIYIYEIPYQVNKATLIEDMASLVKDKVLEGISDIRDESDKEGLTIVIELKKDANPEVVLNQLYKHTSLKTTFGINMLAIMDGQPRTLNLKQILSCFIIHRKRVITRRTKFELKKAEDRAHILEGLKIALANIDEVVKLIKKSKDPAIAREGLMSGYELTEIQAQSILEMKLQRLTSLETENILNELKELIVLIEELKLILASEEKIFNIIKQECAELKEKYGDKRKTVILDAEEVGIIEDEDLIKKEDVVVTLTYSGYVKQLPLATYQSQGRGGKGIKATETKEEDIVKEIFVTNTHSYLLLFTNKGKVHWLKTYQVPQASRYSQGKAVINLIQLEEGEKVNTILPVNEFTNGYILFATKQGTLKKTALEEFSNPRAGGIRAINLHDKDELVEVRLTSGKEQMVIGTAHGQAVKFSEEDIRPIGRAGAGVRGIRLEKDDELIGLEKGEDNLSLLTITENGFGKRTKLNDYRLIRRGGKGVINIKTKYLYADTRNLSVVGIKAVTETDEVMFITEKGIIIRVPISEISEIGRNTQGVRLMKLNEKDKVVAIAKVVREE